METLLTQFLLPVLAAITIMFLYVAFKTSQITKHQNELSDRQYDQTKMTLEKFDYTNKEIGNVHSGVKDLQLKFTESLMPKIDEVYNQLSQSLPPLNPDTLIKYLHDFGLTSAQFITKDHSTIMIGIANEEEKRKTTVLVTLDNKRTRIDFTVFSNIVENPSNEFILELLKMNAALHVGKYSLRKYGKKYLICMEHTLLPLSQKVDSQEIKAVIKYLMGLNDDLYDLIGVFELPSTELLIEQYVELVASDDDYEPLLLRSKKKQIAKSDAT